MFKGTVLILSPHRDDAVLGCGGLIMSHRNHIKQDSICNIGVRYYNTVHPAVNQTVYDAEAVKVSSVGAFFANTSPLTGVNRLDQIPLVDFIRDIEEAINLLAPQVLLVPFPSFNQDHAHLYRAAMTAVRVHDKNWFVPHVLLYEQPQVHHTLSIQNNFTANKFVPIDVEDKLKLYSKYESQQREHRSISLIQNLAALRGSQCDEDYAESFMIMRSK